MADNKDLTGGRDRSRISANQPYEVEHVHSQFPWFSHEEIKEAIEQKGPDRETVVKYLEEKGKGNLSGNNTGIQ